MQKPFEECKTEHGYEAVSDSIDLGMLSDDEFLHVGELFKIFGDPTRVKILYALSFGEKCVCEISSIVEVSQSAVSHQLRVLKTAKLVRYKREGKTILYSLADDHVKTILSQGIEHVKE